MSIDREKLLKALRAAPRGLRADELATALSADAKGKHRLRKLLGDDAARPRHLLTVRGAGWRLLTDPVPPPE